MKFYIQIIIFSAAFSNLVHAEKIPQFFGQENQGETMVGSARVRVLLWDIYDISLYSPAGHYHPDEPFALRLEYLRPIKGEVIAEKSVEEMRRQGVSELKLAAWFVQMKEIFPDVNEGSELIGVFESGKPTVFYNENELIGQIHDPDFQEPFSKIWLGEKTAKPDVRSILIGENK